MTTHLYPVHAEEEPLQVLQAPEVTEVAQPVLLHVHLLQVPLVHEGVLRHGLDLVAVQHQLTQVLQTLQPLHLADLIAWG